MLCSDHHPFADVVQQRRVAILKVLSKKPFMAITDLLNAVIGLGIDTDEETLAFDILNLRQAGIQISKERSFYRLTDKIKLDVIPEQKPITAQQKVNGIEKQIEHYVTLLVVIAVKLLRNSSSSSIRFHLL